MPDLGQFRLWSAVADSRELFAWTGYPTRIELRLGVRGWIDFGPDPPLEGVVGRLHSGREFADTWGDSVVPWEASSDGQGTRLRFAHSGVTGDPVVGLSAGGYAFLDHLESHLAGARREDRFGTLLAIHRNLLEPGLQRP